MILCPIVCIIEFPWLLIESKLFLALSVLKPVEAHVYCFCLRGLDSLIDGAVECCEFCHGGQRRDVLDYVHNVKDGSVVGWDISVVGEKVVVACSAFCLGLVEVASVAADCEGRLAC